MSALLSGRGLDDDSGAVFRHQGDAQARRQAQAALHFAALAGQRRAFLAGDFRGRRRGGQKQDDCGNNATRH